MKGTINNSDDTDTKQNICIGSSTGKNIRNGSANVIIGHNAGSGNNMIDCVGNVIVGYNAGTLVGKSNNILIGNQADVIDNTTHHYLNIGNLITGSMYETTGKYVKINGELDLSDIPTTDPKVSGRVWNDNGTLKISTGA